MSFPAIHPCSDIPLVRDGGAALHLPLSVVLTLIPPLLSVSATNQRSGGRHMSAHLIPPAHISYHCQRCPSGRKAPVKPTEKPI